MMQEESDLDSRIIALLDLLREVPPRTPQQVDRGRASFLAQVQTLTQENSIKTPVSRGPKERLIGWISSFQIPIQKKERKTMMTTLVSFLITLTLFLGGAGATVHAAQNSIPNEPLYQIKLLSEDIQLQLAVQEQNRLKLALEFANQRMEEMTTMIAAGLPVSAQVTARLQQQIEFALQLAARMNNSAMPQALEQIRTALRQHEQTMNKLQASQPGDPLLEQLRFRLREQLRLVEMGISDPQDFQEQIQQRQQKQNEQQQGAPEEPPAPGSEGNGNGQGQPDGVPG